MGLAGVKFVGNKISLLALGDVVKINIVIQNVVMGHGVNGTGGSGNIIFDNGNEGEGDNDGCNGDNNKRLKKLFHDGNYYIILE